MKLESPRIGDVRIDVDMIDMPWSSRRYGEISLDAGTIGSIPLRIVGQITNAAKDVADAYALDGVRLRTSPRVMRSLLCGGWRFWHFGCARRIPTDSGLSLPDGFALRIGDIDHCHVIAGPLAESLRAGIPTCERSWRDGFDFTRGAERWLSDFMARGDLLMTLLERDAIAAYGLLSVSGPHAVLEDVSVLPAYAGRGLSGILLQRIERLARTRGFDVLRATVMHSIPSMRRRLGRRLKAEGWNFDEAHFSLPLESALAAGHDPSSGG